MRVSVALACLVLAVAAVDVSVVPSIQPDNSDPSWDFIMMVNQWWGSLSVTTPANVDDWTLHGAWPQRENGSWPQNCTKEKFNCDGVHDLLPELQKHWPSYKPNQCGFWDHEWTRHGTCASSEPQYAPMHSYFKEVLHMRETILGDVVSVLADHGIVPSNTKLYSKQQFEDALSTITGHRALVSCHKDHSGTAISIDQMYHCFNKDGSPRDCNKTMLEAQCSNDFLFPPLKR